LKRQDFVIAGHDRNCGKFETLGQVHRPNSDLPRCTFNRRC
jgi:hypothetical protein